MRLVASCLRVLNIVWCCSHKGISLTPTFHPLIFFFIFWCLWCVKKFMRFLHWTRTSHDVVMSRYSAVHITLDQAPGAIHFIVVLEPCIVCELLPFLHSFSWVTVTGRRRLQRPCGFSQLWCCCTSVWLMRATRHIDLTQSVAASSGEAKINSSHCARSCSSELF